MRDEFLSEEDLDLKNLSAEERDVLWTAWLKQAQRTNERDRTLYSHGVFIHEPPWGAPGAEARPATAEDWPTTV